MPANIARRKSDSGSAYSGRWDIYSEIVSRRDFDRSAYEAVKGMRSDSVPLLSAWVVVVLMCTVAILGLAVYFALRYSFGFYPNTYVNGVDVSGMDPVSAGRAVCGDAYGYELAVCFRDGERTLTSEDLGISVTFDPSLGSLLEDRSDGGFWDHLWHRHDYSVEVFVEYDEFMTVGSVNRLLAGFPEGAYGKPAGTARSDDGLLLYVDGVQSTRRDDSVARDLILAALDRHDMWLDLRESDCYLDPYSAQDDEILRTTVDWYNDLLGRLPSYSLGGFTVSFDPADASSRMRVTDGSCVEIERDYVRGVIAGTDPYAAMFEGGSYYLHAIPVGDDVKAFLKQVWLECAVDRVVSDMAAGGSSQLPSTDGSVWLSSGYCVLLKPSDGTVVLQKNGVTVGTYQADFVNASVWRRVGPCVCAAYVEDGSVRLSNGVTLGPSGCDVLVADIDGLVDAVGAERLRYAAIQAEGRSKLTGSGEQGGPSEGDRWCRVFGPAAPDADPS